MQKFWMLSSVLLAVLFASGCRSEVVYGEPVYTQMTREEQQRMLEAARQVLLEHPKILLPSEKEEFRRLVPEMLIDYTGDREGKALYIWDLKDKRVRLSMTGKFLERGVKVSVGVSRTSRVKITGPENSAATGNLGLKEMIRRKRAEEIERQRQLQLKPDCATAPAAR